MTDREDTMKNEYETTANNAEDDTNVIFCTKPFDPENSRSLDADDPCRDGEA